jgi:chromosome segregation ATPase
VLQDQVSGAAGADAVAAEAARCREQLSTVQAQLQAGQKQLESADAALAVQCSAVAEADEQLAAIKRDVSVCEPRLVSLRQQLQELEANIRAREAEHQVTRRWLCAAWCSWVMLLLTEAHLHVTAANSSHLMAPSPPQTESQMCAVGSCGFCVSVFLSSLQQRNADLVLANRRLSELREEVSRRQAQLDSVEGLYSERQEALRNVAAELARRRGELSTLEGGLSDSLRRKADSEYQAVEEQLRR